MNRKYGIYACAKSDYHYGPPKEFAHTKIGAWWKARKLKKIYPCVKIENLNMLMRLYKN